jgi:hypothetical protein
VAVVQVVLVMAVAVVQDHSCIRNHSLSRIPKQSLLVQEVSGITWVQMQHLTEQFQITMAVQLPLAPSLLQGVAQEEE